MEIWDLYTKYRERTGMAHTRGEEIPEAYYHLVVHVWIRNHKGEYMMSKRAGNRMEYPFKWECVGGSVIKGEDSLAGALREVKEEVGLDVPPDKGVLLFSKIRNIIDGKRFSDILDVWVFDYDGDIALENATTDEVSECRWMTKEEIRSLYDKGEMVSTLDYFFFAFEDTCPDYSNVIGRDVSGTVDRPLGSAHPRHPDMIYPINYGYVDGVFAGDGAEQDVYIFGTDEPLKSFEGKVIAVFHRFDDVEDKWIVSLTENEIPDEKILGDISFQEQYFCGKLYR